MDRSDLQGLASVRHKEARALLRAGLSDGAYYLAGYTVECALKACIAKGTQRHEFPEKKKVQSSHSHNLRELIRVAGLSHRRDNHLNIGPNITARVRLISSARTEPNHSSRAAPYQHAHHRGRTHPPLTCPGACRPGPNPSCRNAKRRASGSGPWRVPAYRASYNPESGTPAQGRECRW